MKKVLITGATGFIGKHCIAHLVKKKYIIHATFKDLPNEKLNKNATWHQCNLLNPLDIKKLFKQVRPSHLLHLAWFVEPGSYLNSMNNISWLENSINLIKEFITYGGKRIVTTGTCLEYDLQYGYCSETITPLKQTSLYAKSKHALHSISEELCSINNISHLWCRIFFTYGPGEYTTRFIPAMILSLLSNKKFTCRTYDQIRDYLYVEDVADALVCSLDNNKVGAINIASGNPTKIKEIASTIGELTNKLHLIEFKENQLYKEPPIILANTHRLLNEIGFSQSLTLEQGIKKTINWLS